jgi:glucokinase
MISETAIGIDIGGTNIRAARISRSGDISEWTARPTSTRPAEAVAQLGQMIRTLNDGTVRAVGVGLPGRVDVRHAAILSGGYVDLTGVPLATALKDYFDGLVVLDNDANMALVGEQAVGRARGLADVVMFTIGTGIGGAIFSNGAIFRGRATAGQLGHITVDRDGEPCLCGRRGCVEMASSGTALGRLIASAGLNAGTTAEDLLRDAAHGDERASRILGQWARPLRAAIDSAVAAFDPELVLLGGGLGVAARRALKDFPAISPWYQCPVEAASLGDRAGVIGAGLSALAAIP